MGCNYISEAILSQSCNRLHDVISKYPAIINEPNVIGQGPLHLSTHWIEGLEILIRAGANVEVADNNGLTPVAYAMIKGRLEAVRVLAQAGCKFSHRGQSYLRGIMSTDFRESEISYRDFAATVELTIEVLAKRTQQLQELSETFLSSRTRSAITSHKREESISREGISRTISALLGAGVVVPPPLLSLEEDLDNPYGFQYLGVRYADKLWNLGFRNTDEANKLGLTPIMKSDRVSFSSMR